MRLTPAREGLRGQIAVPPDKSIAHRALILGALCRKGLAVRRLPSGGDLRSTLKVLQGLGCALRMEGTGVVIEGGDLRPPAGPLDCGNSATTMRLLAGVLAGHPFAVELSGDASLSARPMRRLAIPLRAMGAAVDLAGGEHPPVWIRGRHPLKSLSITLDVPSAQVKSAVLLAGLFAEGPTSVADPFGTRDHTERMLQWLSYGERFVRQGQVATVHPGFLEGGGALEIPGDISSAAFWIGAACLVPGSDLLLHGVSVNPTRTGFLSALRQMGGVIEETPAREEGGEPTADLAIRFREGLEGIRVPAEAAPSLIDEAPILAVAAAFARGETRLEGLAELRRKESNRLEGTAAGLCAMGARAYVEGDALVVQGPTVLRGGRVDTQGDHRLAMAFAVAALAARGETLLSDAGCVEVSYPDFFHELSTLLDRR